jgi:hypothetical protein
VSRELFADIRQQGHVPGSLDGILDGALESRAVAAALTAKELSLAGAHFLETGHVFVIDKSRPRAPLFGAEPAAIFSTPSELLADHEFASPFIVSRAFLAWRRNY